MLLLFCNLLSYQDDGMKELVDLISVGVLYNVVLYLGINLAARR